MSLVRKMHKNTNYEEDLKNLLNSIKVEVNNLEGLTNKNGSRKELNRIVHKLNEMRTMSENCYDKAKLFSLTEVMEQAKKMIKRIRKIENQLFSSIKQGNYYTFQ